MPSFAANLTWMFNEYEFPDRFIAAADCGFRAVECQFPYAWDKTLLAEKLVAADLRQLMFNMPAGDLAEGEYGLSALPGREAEFRESVAFALGYADALNCRMLHVLAGIVPPGHGQDEYMQTYLDNLIWVAEACRKHDVTVLVEPINTIEKPGYLISTSTQARQVIEQVAAANLAMQFDFHNAQLMEGNLAAALQANLKHIRHMQIAGVPNRTPPDQGEINYAYLFDLVDTLGYEGWLGCEFRPGESTLAGLAWAKPYGIG